MAGESALNLRSYYLRTNFAGLLLCLAAGAVSYRSLHPLEFGGVLALFVGSLAATAGMAWEGSRWGGQSFRLWQGALTAWGLGLGIAVSCQELLLGAGVAWLISEWAVYRARPDATAAYVQDSLADILAWCGLVCLLLLSMASDDPARMGGIVRMTAWSATSVVIYRRARLPGCLVGLVVWSVLLGLAVMLAQATHVAGSWNALLSFLSLAGALYAVDGLDRRK